MKLSRSKLKQIITEEIDRMEEIKNDAVQIATMQAAAQEQSVNNSDDIQILQDIAATVKTLAHLVSGLSDKSMQGACIAPLNSFHEIIDQVSVDADDRPNTTPTQWGESESAPPE
jgi:hypothetical protein